ncbi:MAG: hypothetical protein HY785_15995 [Oscillatoriophycideae cyanobacterium NC_groundwater_1537_Pr4_S-0.65um_50_18]|nr:hypothetical protein [Oscillatoriophycideae cyanobacterium NC_groundwater_1537_Pr4_S-0.65um_50_18]
MLDRFAAQPPIAPQSLDHDRTLPQNPSALNLSLRNLISRAIAAQPKSPKTQPPFSNHQPR